MEYDFEYPSQIAFHGHRGISFAFGRIIATIGHGRIIVFDKKGQLIHKVDLVCESESTYEETHKSYEPSGICNTQEELSILDRENKRIQTVNSNYNLVRSVSLGDFEPEKIYNSRQGLVLVTTIEGVVVVINRDGQIVKKFGSCGSCKGKFLYPDGVCVNSRKEILVVDCGNERVQIFDKNGVFICEFGSIGDEPNQFSRPYGICVDNHDNIYVADFNNDRISVFDSMANPIQQIPFSGPRDLCLMEDKIVAISLYNKIGIFSNNLP